MRDRWVLLEDKDADEDAPQLHGPFTADEAIGFVLGVEFVNDSSITVLGICKSSKLPRDADRHEYDRGIKQDIKRL